MFSIGLTGGIGSGKSQVADLLADLGAAVIDTDLLAHALTAADGAAIAPIRQAFGPQAIAANGALDRGWMRTRVFSDAQARRQLEAILHPMIHQCATQRAAQAEGAYVVFVVPLLVENGRWHDRVARICVVDCDAATQIARVQTRSGLTPEMVQRIMQAQATRQARLAVADDVIVNDGSTSLAQLEAQTRRQHDLWKVMAQSA